MKPDEDRTPEHSLFYCPYCGEIVEESHEAIKSNGKYYHEFCYEEEQSIL